MKAVLAFLTSCAIAAGLLWGYLEHPRSRGGPSEVQEVQRISPPPEAEKEAAPPAPMETKEEPPAPPEPRLPVPSQEELSARIKEIEAAILKEDFQAAEAAIDPLIEKYRGNPEALALLEKPRRAAKKAKAFASVLASLDTRELPETLYKVEITNGVKFVATSKKESEDGWRFEVISGGFSSWSRDKVAAVSPFPRKAYLDGRWKEIQENSKHWKDPVDLFFFGVRKCFRDGLRREGLGMMDRLLAMPESAQVVVIYVKDGEAVRSWEQAAGREALEPLSREEETRIASTVPSTAVPPAREDEKEEADSKDVLNRVQELIEQAEATYRDAKGDPDKVFQAKTLIWGPVAKILFGIPGDDLRVQNLKRRAQDLMSKIMNEK